MKVEHLDVRLVCFGIDGCYDEPADVESSLDELEVVHQRL
jgi:hypothetical protein